MDSINGPSLLVPDWASHPISNSLSRQSTLHTSTLSIERCVAMETSVKTQYLVVYMQCV